MLRNDSDVDASDVLSIANVDTAMNGTVNLDSNGNIIFIPDSIFSGGSFKYSISDGHGGTATASVNIFGSFTTSVQTSDTPINSSSKTLSPDPIADGFSQARSQGSTNRMGSIVPEAFGTLRPLRPPTLMHSPTLA